MNNKIISTIFTWVVFLSIILVLTGPTALFAADCTGNCPTNQRMTNTGSKCECVDATASLPNPLGMNSDLLTTIVRIMQVALGAVDVFALFMFILGGFQFLVSAGNPNMIKRAKDTLVWATIGIVIITLSFSLMKFVFESVTKNIGA